MYRYRCRYTNTRPIKIHSSSRHTLKSLPRTSPRLRQLVRENAGREKEEEQRTLNPYFHPRDRRWNTETFFLMRGSYHFVFLSPRTQGLPSPRRQSRDLTEEDLNKMYILTYRSRWEENPKKWVTLVHDWLYI